jgi:hypothetical protein
MWNAGSIFRILRVSHSMQSPALYSCSLVFPLITDVFCAYNPQRGYQSEGQIKLRLEIKQLLKEANQLST